MAADDLSDDDALPDLEPATAPTVREPVHTGPARVPAVHGIDIEQDSRVIEARARYADAAARHLKVWRQLQGLREKAGLKPGEPVPSESAMKTYIARAVREGRDVDPAAIGALHGFAMAEAELAAAVSVAADAIHQEVPRAMLRASEQVTAAVRKETAALASAWAELLKRGAALEGKLGTFRAAGWQQGWHNAIPTLLLNPAEQLAALPHADATQKRLRDLLAAGLLKPSDVAGLLRD